MTDLGEPIASGRSAQVYAWKNGQVVKLLRPEFSEWGLGREARAARAAYELGLPAPAVYGELEIDGRPGLAFERIDGPTMLDALMAHPESVVEMGRTMAELHAQVHDHAGPESLPAQHSRLEEGISRCEALPEALRAQVLQRLASLPTGDRLCHGDFWPAQILMSQPQPTIIDWVDAKRGNPLADVARALVLLAGVEAMPLPEEAKQMVGAFRNAYLSRYIALTSASPAEIDAWMPVRAAARLNEKIPGLEEWLLAQVRAGLAAD